MHPQTQNNERGAEKMFILVFVNCVLQKGVLTGEMDGFWGSHERIAYRVQDIYGKLNRNALMIENRCFRDLRNDLLEKYVNMNR